MAAKLEVDPATLIVLASALSKGMSDEQLLEVIQQECQGLNSCGALERIADHFQEGKVTRTRPGKQIDPQKLAAIRLAKAAGESQASVSARLGIAKSTVGRLWHYPED